MNYKQKTLKEFHVRFPRLKSNFMKGSKLDALELKKIVLFLDKNKVRMYSVCFKKEAWRERLLEHQAFGHEAHWVEKTIAMLIFRLLKNYCYVGKTKDKNGIRYEPEYNVIIDEKSNFDMDVMFDNCRRLCKGRKINVSFLKTKAKFSDTIKFADYLAAAHRKLGESQLKSLENFKLITPEFSESEKNRALRFSKWSKKKIIKGVDF